VKKDQNLNDIFAALSARGIEIVRHAQQGEPASEELFLRLVEGRDSGDRPTESGGAGVNEVTDTAAATQGDRGERSTLGRIPHDRHP